MKKNILIIITVVLWIISVGIGFAGLYNYEFKSGAAGHLAIWWPTGSAIKRHNDAYQFVMVAHPRCPCTMASLGELELIMANGWGKVNAYVLFVKPKGFDTAWAETDLFKYASKIPGVRVIIDDDGKQAKLFGGTTSGQTFLYDPQGHLIFTGGITDSRGHSGDNVGRSTVVALINHQPVDVHNTKFFGCLLNDRPEKIIAREKG